MVGAPLYLTDKSKKIFRAIANSPSQMIPSNRLFLKVKGFDPHLEEAEIEESLQSLEFHNLVGKSGDFYYLTSTGNIVGKKMRFL